MNRLVKSACWPWRRPVTEDRPPVSAHSPSTSQGLRARTGLIPTPSSSTLSPRLVTSEVTHSFIRARMWHSACRRTVRSEGGAALSVGRLSTAAKPPRALAPPAGRPLRLHDGHGGRAVHTRPSGGANLSDPLRLVLGLVPPHRKQDAGESSSEG